MNKDVGFRWYSGEEEEDDNSHIRDVRFQQLDQGGAHDHQLQPQPQPTTSTTSDIFSFWSDAIQPPSLQQQQQQLQEQEYTASMAATCLPQVLDMSYLNVDYLPTQTDAVVTTAVTAAAGISQGSGQHHNYKRLKSTPHNVSEKRRRDRFKEKIKTLQELLPDCDKRDTASVLEKTVQQIQLLKFQVQEQNMSSTIRALSPSPVIPPTQTNVVGMVPYPAMQLLHYPNIPQMPMTLPLPIQMQMQMQMLPFFPLGHTSPSSSIATAGPIGGLLGPPPGETSTQVAIPTSSAQPHEGGAGAGAVAGGSCSGSGRLTFPSSSAGGSGKDAQ